MSVTKTIANFMRETFNVALQLLQIKKHEITHCDVFYITQKEIEKLRGILDPSRTLVGIDALRRVIFVDDSSLYRYKNSNKFVIFMTQNSAKALSFKNACAFTNPFDFKKATEFIVTKKVIDAVKDPSPAELLTFFGYGLLIGAIICLYLAFL